MKVIDLDGVLAVIGTVTVLVATGWMWGPYALGIMGFAVTAIALRGLTR